MPEKIDFQGETVFRLKRGEDEILFAPQYGARLLKWKTKGRDIIYWPEEVNWFQASKIRGGNPILFPFVGRVHLGDRQGFWQDDKGNTYPMQQHGFCRDAEFFFVQDPNDGENTVRMRLEASQGTRKVYPYDFAFDVVYELGENELICTFKINNIGKEDMIYYAGHHFYFAMDHKDRADWQLNLPCQQWAYHLPEGEVAYEFATHETTSFADKKLWNRLHVKPKSHEVTWENAKIGQKLQIELDPTVWPCVTTWAEFDESDYYCIEPWQSVPNATETGKYLRLLAPGQQETATCRIKVLQ
jgi:aldose 1-epimerase